VVAALAGVSRSTVSRVVNGSPRVTPEAIVAVNAAIDQLGYVPNRAARMLAQRRTQTIALVIPENTAKFFADPYFAEVIQGAAMHLAATDYTLTLLIASETDPEKTRRFLQGGNVDGAMILSHHSDDTSYVKLAGTIPVVFGGRPMSQEGPGAIVVDVDNVAASRQATEYLVSKGRTRIATIGGPADMAAGLDRVAGWRDALEAAGLEPGPLERGDFTPPGGADAMQRILATGAPFDAIFAASAQMAFGALAALREAGLSVPDDVAIAAVDDDYYAENAVPPLTTIKQPTVEQGAKIAEVLVRLIGGEDVPALTVMPTRLVVRESA
jgi:LacI family transcriptional regulator